MTTDPSPSKQAPASKKKIASDKSEPRPVLSAEFSDLNELLNAVEFLKTERDDHLMEK